MIFSGLLLRAALLAASMTSVACYTPASTAETDALAAIGLLKLGAQVAPLRNWIDLRLG